MLVDKKKKNKRKAYLEGLGVFVLSVCPKEPNGGLLVVFHWKKKKRKKKKRKKW